jgi:hypothetical protein
MVKRLQSRAIDPSTTSLTKYITPRFDLGRMSWNLVALNAKGRRSFRRLQESEIT